MSSPRFEVVAPFQPAGDQPKAIAELAAGLRRGDKYQTLLGVTGSGKTMTLAHTIAAHGRPTLVLSHNKTLAAQLYGELRQFLPRNAVEYFVSYYDYYQPEAYVPSTDVYIEKDASINQDIESLRLRATSSLMEREDVVIVATVSAIYGLGDPVEYRKLMVTVRRGESGVGTRYSASWCASSTAATTPPSSRAPSGSGETPSRCFPPMPNRPSGSSCGATRSSGSARSIRLRVIPSPSSNSVPSIPPSTSSPSAPRSSGPSCHPGGAGRTAGRAQGRGQAARGPAARVAHQLRHGDAARGRHLRGHRELLTAAERPAGRRAPGLPHRLLPRRLPGGGRRVARVAPADRRDVQRRPGPQDSWSSTDSASLRHSTTGRSSSTNSCRSCPR